MIRKVFDEGVWTDEAKLKEALLEALRQESQPEVGHMIQAVQ